MTLLYNTTDDIYISSQVVGYIAGTLVISYNIPQLIKMIKTKSTDDVALLSLIFQIILNTVYITYGALLQEIPLMVSESIAFIICASMVILKRKYDKHQIMDSSEDHVNIELLTLKQINIPVDKDNKLDNNIGDYNNKAGDNEVDDNEADV